MVVTLLIFKVIEELEKKYKTWGDLIATKLTVFYQVLTISFEEMFLWLYNSLVTFVIELKGFICLCVSKHNKTQTDICSKESRGLLVKKMMLSLEAQVN